MVVMAIYSKTIDFFNSAAFCSIKKETALKECGTVLPAEHLRLSREPGKIIITLLSCDGMAIGKSLLQLLDHGESLNNAEEIIINSYSSADLQFITSYIVAPPGQQFALRFQGKQLTIRLHTLEAALQLPALITTAGNCTHGEETCSILPEIFKKEVRYELVETSLLNRFHLLNYIAETREEIRSRYDLAVNDKDKLCLTLDKIKEYIVSEKVSFIPEEPVPPQTHELKRLPVVDQDLLSRILAGETLYTVSDETSHITLIKNTLYVIDAGMLATPEYVQELLDAAPERIQNITIIQTHFHNDHCARLAQVLELIRATNIPTQLILHKAVLHQFAGFYATHLNSFKHHPRLSLLVADNGNIPYYAGATITTLSLTPELLAHYIPSREFLIHNEGRGKYFTGDFNPPAPEKIQGADPVQEVITNIRLYLKRIADLAQKQGITSLEIYADVGHFMVNPAYVEAFQRSILELNTEYRHLQLSLLAEHIKSKENYQLHTSAQAIKQPKELKLASL